MIAESRDIDAGNLASLQHCHSLGDFNRVPINEHLDGVIRVGEVDPGSGDGVPLRKIWFGLDGGGSGFGVVEVRRGADGAAEDVGGFGGGESGGSDEGS